jgi:streptogramin lyase
MAYGAGSIWVEDFTSDKVTRINVTSLKTRTFRVGSAPFDIRFGYGAAWVTNNASSSLSRIDARTGDVRTIKVGVDPDGIALAAGALWVVNTTSASISRVDPATLKVTSEHLGGNPTWVAYAGSTIWVSDERAGEILRLDATTGRIGARVKVGPTPGSGSVFSGALWVTDNDGSIYRIDPQTDQVTGHWQLPVGNPFVISGYADRLWVTDYAGTDTIEIDPSQLPED